MNSSSPKTDFIDVRELAAELGVDGARRTAEDYFSKLERSILAKPFNNINETPELLGCLAQVLQGLELMPGLTIIDFGCGAGWLSRWLTQAGLNVIAVDVSESALRRARELYELNPVIGDHRSPRFLHFNGHGLELENESVDRIISFDAFHHAPNPDEVIGEFGRVLKLGGIVGFSEPGPDHSATRQAQSEMRMYRTVENDIRVEQIWDVAKECGFTNIKVAVLNPNLFLLPLDDFQNYVSGGNAAEIQFAAAARQYVANHRIFFLYKGVAEFPSDSRQPGGLHAGLDLKLTPQELLEGHPLTFPVTVTNIGTSVWLTRVDSDNSVSAEPLMTSEGRVLKENLRRGEVHLGSHLFNDRGELIERDYSRHALTSRTGAVAPGETISLNITLPCPASGRYILEFDMVSEWVCWFELNGSKTARIELVIQAT